MTSHDHGDADQRISRRLALSLAAVGGSIGVARLLISSEKVDADTKSNDDHSGHSDDESDDTTPDNDDHEGKVAPLGTVPSGSAEVRIIDDDADGFFPGTITIDRGQKITFVNRDDDPHTATGAAFDTGIMQPGEQQTIVFEEAGSFPYSCQIHPVMTGVVDVRGGTVQPSASPAASPFASPVAGGASFDVAIADFSFEPAEVTVPAGSIVMWHNTGAAPHTASAADQSFDTGIIDPGANASHAFTEAGEYPYFCAFHPSMTAKIVVI